MVLMLARHQRSEKGNTMKTKTNIKAGHIESSDDESL
jgi:hypothetical protein